MVLVGWVRDKQGKVLLPLDMEERTTMKVGKMETSRNSDLAGTLIKVTYICKDSSSTFQLDGIPNDDPQNHQ